MRLPIQQHALYKELGQLVTPYLYSSVSSRHYRNKCKLIWTISKVYLPGILYRLSGGMDAFASLLLLAKQTRRGTFRMKTMQTLRRLPPMQICCCVASNENLISRLIQFIFGSELIISSINAVICMDQFKPGIPLIYRTQSAVLVRTKCAREMVLCVCSISSN